MVMVAARQCARRAVLPLVHGTTSWLLTGPLHKQVPPGHPRSPTPATSDTMSALVLAVMCAAVIAAQAAAATPPPPAPLPTQLFGFGYAFGDDMVLQQAPSKAAVYGFLSAGGTAVKVTVSSGGKELYSVDATMNSTHQAFGGAFGKRPCLKDACPPYDMHGWNPWNAPLATWKALLPPTPATKGVAYNITARCTGCTGNTTDTITGVVFGDMW